MSSTFVRIRPGTKLWEVIPPGAESEAYSTCGEALDEARTRRQAILAQGGVCEIVLITPEGHFADDGAPKCP